MKQNFIDKFKHERTFVMLKPDAVQRGLVGKIISHFEDKALKIVAMKMINATEEQINSHYPMKDDAWLTRLGMKSLSTFEELNIDPTPYFENTDKHAIGKQVATSLVNYMMSGPVIAMIVEGIQAVDAVRKMVGFSLPQKADIGTIRSLYSIDTPLVANLEGRPLHNMIHASEKTEEVDQEIKVWFGEAPETFTYELTDEKVAYTRHYA